MGIIIKQSVRSSIYAYVGIFLGFITTALLMPKYLTEAQVGLVRLITSISLLLAQFSNLGYNAAGGRMFPYFRNEKNHHNGYLFWAGVVSAVGLMLTIGFWFFNQKFILNFLNAPSSPLLYDYLYLVIPITIFTVIFFIFDNYLRFIFDTVTGTFLKELAQRVFFLLAIVLYIFGLYQFSTYVYAYTVALCLPTLIIVWHTWHKGNLYLKPIRGFWQANIRKQFISLSALTFLSGFTSQVVLYLDQIQVTKLINLSANGIYSTMMMFGTVIYTPTLLVNRIGGAIISEAWKNDDKKTIMEVYSKSCLNLLIIGSLLFLIIVCNLQSLFEVLPNYESGKWVVIWIAIGKLFDMSTGLNGTILQTSKYYYYDTLFMVFLILGTWLLNNWLIPIYGITGSAIATTTIIIVFNIFRTLFVYGAFKMYPFSLKNIWVVLLASMVFLVIKFLPNFNSVLFLPSYLVNTAIRTFLISGLFLGSIYWFKISSDINSSIDGFIQKYSKFLN